MRTLLTWCALALVGCVELQPVVPPPDGEGDCSSACANLDALGCGLGPTCVPDCSRALEEWASVEKRIPVGCWTASRTCAEAEACR
jgi:hypothetical protein